MDIGKYDRRIEFFEFTTAQQEEGTNEIVANEMVKGMWAKVVPLSSQNSYQNSQFVEDGTVRFEVRFNPEFMPNKKHSLGYNSKLYTITEILDVNDRHEVLRITALSRD